MSAYADALESIFTSEQKYTVLQLIKALINAIDELAGHTVVSVSVSQTTPHQGEPTTVTLTLTFDDDTTTNLSFTVPAGRQGIQGATGPQGEQGVGIRECRVQQQSDDRFELEFTLDDNRIIGTGYITLPEGPQGPQGPAGADGITVVTSSSNFETDRDAIIAAWPKVIYYMSGYYYQPAEIRSGTYYMIAVTPFSTNAQSTDYYIKRIRFYSGTTSQPLPTELFVGYTMIQNRDDMIPTCKAVKTYVDNLLASVVQLPSGFGQGDMLVGDSQGGLTVIDAGTPGQVLGTDQNGLPEWQTPSGGGGSGDTVQGGYEFVMTNDVGADRATFLALGRNADTSDQTNYGKYGWLPGDGYTPFENVSMVVITSMGYPSGDFNSMTQNVLFTADGTPINDHAGLVAAVGKLCYLKGNCGIYYED